jgi:hypothetical protein
VQFFRREIYVAEGEKDAEHILARKKENEISAQHSI